MKWIITINIITCIVFTISILIFNYTFNNAVIVIHYLETYNIKVYKHGKVLFNANYYNNITAITTQLKYTYKVKHIIYL